MTQPSASVNEEHERFSLLGGPLHRLGARLGLVRGHTNTVALGLALGLSAWLIGALLGVVEGAGARIFSLSIIASHVRLLLVIPLMFLCETLLDPRTAAFVRVLVESKVVRDGEVHKLDVLIGQVARWRNSWIPEAVCLAAAIYMSIGVAHLALPGTSSEFNPSETAAAGIWYWAVCLPLFRFLALRWLWRLLLWWYFLWRVARLQLHIVPTHPDGVGGLGYLEVVHAEFSTLIFAISAALAAAFDEAIAAGSLKVSTVYSAIALILILDAAVFVGPLCIFAPKLWRARVTGLDTYMDLASRYVMAFEKKWLGKVGARRDDLLGSEDLQALADLNNSMSVVTNMRLMPATYRLGLILAVAALAPMAPLLLFQYPIAELSGKLFKIVLGL